MAVNIVDKYLQFVQKHFNSESVDIRDIIKALDLFSQDLNIQERYRKEAERLKATSSSIVIIQDDDKYNKFDKLGNFDLDNVNEVYKVSDEIIKDINIARNWLKSYKKFISEQQNQNVQDLHTQLIKLGQSILGRAIELTPIDTGFLRSSGILIDFKNYIVIAFTAPYATYVHENLENRHNVGRAKFLEIALQEFFPDRRVWTETHGFSGVEVTIGLNPDYVKYKHYN